MVSLNFSSYFLQFMVLFIFVVLLLKEFRYFLTENIFDIDVFKEGMGLQVREHEPFLFISTQSVLRDFNKEFFNQVYGLIIDSFVFWECHINILNLLKYLILVGCLKRGLHVIQLINNAP